MENIFHKITNEMRHGALSQYASKVSVANNFYTFPWLMAVNILCSIATLAV